ncbi:hypothetical protein PR002_g29573 [Phytophthora rubi]|uniref:Uncharacterized protein n=1 Tax=Phytophthora rubi TaxID=129364 RepID=A0A6A3H0R4_9STRA|nr:hypothetical protein PR002_g29573 [Phytophthora rubi]
MLTQELAQELAVQKLAQESTGEMAEELPQKLGAEDFVLALEEKLTQELAVQEMAEGGAPSLVLLLARDLVVVAPLTQDNWGDCVAMRD